MASMNSDSFQGQADWGLTYWPKYSGEVYLFNREEEAQAILKLFLMFVFIILPEPKVWSVIFFSPLIQIQDKAIPVVEKTIIKSYCTMKSLSGKRLTKCIARHL
jgi:hypothetical protein